MVTQVYYTYLGTNGTITSPVHLEDIYYTRLIQLVADKNKVLTSDNKTFLESVLVPDEEVENWKEVDKVE